MLLQEVMYFLFLIFIISFVDFFGFNFVYIFGGDRVIKGLCYYLKVYVQEFVVEVILFLF